MTDVIIEISSRKATGNALWHLCESLYENYNNQMLTTTKRETGCWLAQHIIYKYIRKYVYNLVCF